MTTRGGTEARSAFVDSLLSWLQQNNLSAKFLQELSKEAGLIGGVYASQFTKLCNPAHDYCPRPEFFHALREINNWIAGLDSIPESVTTSLTLRLRQAQPYVMFDDRIPEAYELWGMFEGELLLNKKYNAIVMSPKDINAATKRLQNLVYAKRKEYLLTVNDLKDQLIQLMPDITDEDWNQIILAASELDQLSPEFIYHRLPAVTKALNKLKES